MLRRVNFYSICIAFCLSILLIIAGNRYTDNTSYRPASESRRNIRNFFRIEDGEDNYVQIIPTHPEDGSPDIERILENQRLKIRNEFSTDLHNLEDLLFESGGQPLRHMIVSTWRSGTTFLGEILNALPGNFYHYEPLLKYDIIQIRGSPYAEKALNTIRDMLNCNFEDMADYFEYGKTHLHQFSHNTRLWDHCKYKKDLCFDANFTSRFCRLFPFQSMKVVRLRLKLIEELLKDKEFRTKVILLVRDPRGVMQSRQHRKFCLLSSDCFNPELLCADMISDYVAAARLLRTYPDKLMVLRYEELALNPNNTTHQLYKFLGLIVPPSVEDFLQSHTRVEVAGVSSTFRVSKEVPFRWKQVLEFEYVEEIQAVCKEAMDLWGYKMAHNQTHMQADDFNPLLEYSIVE